MNMRLDRLLSALGVASRSELRQIIRLGRVSVDGQTVTAPERRVDPERERRALEAVRGMTDLRMEAGKFATNMR